MFRSIQHPITRSMLVPCLIACGLALGATHLPPDGNAGKVGASAVPSPSASGCLLFLDYREWDFIFFTRFHMADHGIGYEDPAEMVAPKGEWQLVGIEYVHIRPHGLESGYTRHHLVHGGKCSMWSQL